MHRVCNRGYMPNERIKVNMHPQEIVHLQLPKKDTWNRISSPFDKFKAVGLLNCK